MAHAAAQANRRAGWGQPRCPNERTIPTQSLLPEIRILAPGIQWLNEITRTQGTGRTDGTLARARWPTGDGEEGEGEEKGSELTEEVREAVEPLRVAERAHADLHTRRRLQTRSTGSAE